MFRIHTNAFRLMRLSAFFLAAMSWTTVATPADEEPTSESKIKVGDTVVVTQDKTSIGLGGVPLHWLDKGTKAEVLQITADWIGVELKIDDKVVKGWIAPDRIKTAPPEIKKAEPRPVAEVAKKPAAKEEPTERAKTQETLADKFAKMMKDKEQGKAETKETPSEPDKSAEAVSKPVAKSAPPPSPVAAAPGEPPKATQPAGSEQSNATEAAAGTSDAATPTVKVEAEPSQSKPEADTQPKQDETQTDATKSTATPPSIAPVDERQQDTPPALEAAAPKPEEAQAVEAQDTPAAKPKDEPTKEPPVVEPKTDQPAETPTGDPALGEGPEPLAEKFAEILARLRAQDQQGSPLTEKPKETPQETETAPEASEPYDDAAKAEPITTNVLVLRRTEDLLELEPTGRIGRLILSGDQFGNRTLRGLDGLSVATLSVEAVNVSNAGIQHIQNVRGLESLRLWSPAIDDQGMKLVGQMRSLEVLDLEGTAVEGAGLGDLEPLADLRALVLGPKTVDAGIAHLSNLPKLRQLDLRACDRLTLDVVKALGELTKLEIVWLPSHIRTKAKRALKEVLPECQVRS